MKMMSEGQHPKTTKKLAMYRAVSHHEDHNCGNCKSMHPDGSCDKVRGQVDRRHVCDLWTAEEQDVDEE
jgi:hypothetical protein